jgi:hypothetical protein
MDEDAIYDVNDFNDRLLLGLKGTMSEAEIHFLHARMRGGTISKAKRGELKRALSAGYVYDSYDKIVMDPDVSVQNAINLLFKTFERTGSACATVREFNRQDLKIPKRLLCGPRKGELVWNPLEHSRTLRILNNPLYAGIYYYGRQQIKNTINGKRQLFMPIDDWHVYMPDAHPGYITRAQFEENLKKLKDNCCAYGGDRRKSPPREGPALLQGIVICGKCGKRMSVRYQKNCSKLVPIYTCTKDYIKSGKKVCQTVMGEKIDQEIGALILEMLNPLAIKAAIKVENELDKRKIETENFFKQQVQRAQYETEIARRRYMLVDPANRLVATELESEWNSKIRELEKQKEEYEKKKKDHLRQVSKTIRSDIVKITEDFASIWGSKNVSFKDKKRMLRLLIEDVTIKNSGKDVVANIRFKAGTSKTLAIEKKLPIWEVKKTRKDIVRQVDELTENYTPSEIADILNEKGYRAWNGNLFNLRTISRIIRNYDIKSRYRRLRDKGCLSLKEKMLEANLSQAQIMQMRNEGKIIFYRATDRIEYLYAPQNKGNDLSKIQPCVRSAV